VHKAGTEGIDGSFDAVAGAAAARAKGVNMHAKERKEG